MPDIKQKQRTPIKNINKKIVYSERIKDHFSLAIYFQVRLNSVLKGIFLSFNKSSDIIYLLSLR